MHDRGLATSQFPGFVDMRGRAEYNLGTGECDEQEEDSDSRRRSGPGDLFQPSLAIAPKEAGERGRALKSDRRGPVTRNRLSNQDVMSRRKNMPREAR